MKVEQEGTDFVPITIILETKEEADLMWAVLEDSTPSNAYDLLDDLSSEEVEDLAWRMWSNYDHVYSC